MVMQCGHLELNKNGLSDRLFLFIQHWNKVVVDVSTRD